jgi:hypothetical protein
MQILHNWELIFSEIHFYIILHFKSLCKVTERDKTTLRQNVLKLRIDYI